MSVLVLGTFDGVHIGHRELIGRANGYRQDVIVCTFDAPPANFFGNETPMLTDVKEKKRLLLSCGAKEVFVQKFDSSIAELSAQEYIEMLVKKFKPVRIVTGSNHRLGKNAECDYRKLHGISLRCGVIYETVRPVMFGDRPVSSTAIREAVMHGDMLTAKKMLGRYYSVPGTVIEGKKIGRTIGFPTINIKCGTLLPERGVYVTHTVFDNKEYKSMTNIGVAPTVGDGNELSTETHIFGFSGDLYGKNVRIKFLKKIRDEEKFASLDELKKRLAFDAILAKGC